ncbi:MAG: 16S rRNA (guanine(527)-N(7))-methyltransferase RsmG [Ignavibacteriaceae bacterium]|nr:16S rRNA (guanine(527)-N(7))-methyltransferase RsmG [Ignavibacteriaceae bacterium]
MEFNDEVFLRQLTTFFFENEIVPNENILDRLTSYAELLVQKNKVVNLISRKDVEHLAENHIFISAYIAKFIPEKCSTFIDIGTGGGLPGIPVSIMKPEMKGILVDSISKKIIAVGEFIDKLMLSNVKTENDRVEQPEFIMKYYNHFDLALSRGTVPLDTLVKYALPVVKQKSFIMSIKGGNINVEIDKMNENFNHIVKKCTVFELNYKPTNIKNIKEKKLVLLEINK